MDENDHVKGDEGQRQPGHTAWLAGIVLIAAGVALLLSNLTGFRVNNWWALFVLIPALGALANAYRVRQHTGRLTRDARNSVMGAVLLAFIAGIFLLDLSWAKFWPGLLILGGVGALLNALAD